MSANPFSLRAGDTLRGGAWLRAQQATLLISEALALADALSLFLGKALTDSATLADALALKTGIEITDVASLVDAVNVGYLYALSEADALTVLDVLAFTMKKAITGGNVTANPFSVRAGDMLRGGAWLRGATPQNLPEMTLADTLSKRVSTTLTDILSLAEAFSFQTGLPLTETLSLAENIALKSNISVLDAFTLSDALRIKFTLPLQAAPVYQHYQPRPLIRVTVGVETKRYSTEDVEVPGTGYSDSYGGSYGG